MSKTIIPMVDAVEIQTKKFGLIDEKTWKKATADLHKIANRDEEALSYIFL